MAGHFLDRAAIEQVGAVFQDRVQGVVLLRHQERQVERRRADLEIHGLGLQTRERRRVLGTALQDEHRLEQRGHGRIALRSHRLDDFLERQILPVQRLESGAPRAPQELGERRVARQVGAQDEGIDEDTDDRLGLETRASRNRRPDAQILLARQTPQKRLESRQKNHERRGPFAPRQVPQAQDTVGRNHEPDPGAAIGRRRRARAVERQAENRRRAQEMTPPELQESPRLVPLEPEPLPAREVRVLDRRFRKG